MEPEQTPGEAAWQAYAATHHWTSAEQRDLAREAFESGWNACDFTIRLALATGADPRG